MARIEAALIAGCVASPEAWVGPCGVTAFEAPDVADRPTEELAVTVNVYAVPFVRPVTVQVRGPLVQVQVLARASAALTT